MPDLKDIDMVGIIMLLAKCFYGELNLLQKEVVDNCLMWFYHCYVSLAYILLHQCLSMV